jgi:plastocyanin
VQVSGLSQVIAITAGCCHSLALTQDGTVYAWGNDESGQLGGSITGDSATRPVRLAGLAGAQAIATGSTYSLAIAATRIRIGDLTLAPTNPTVQVGDSVLWANDGGEQHRLVSERGDWDTGNLGAGHSFARAFPQSGVFPSACAIHPALRGRVTVARRAYQRVEDDAASITYGGRWRPSTESQASGGRATYWDDAQPGQASLSWSGQDVRVVMATGPRMGMVSIEVDGDAVGELVDLYSPEPGYQRVVFELQDLPSGTHQVAVIPMAQRNPQSGGYQVALDAFDTR